MFYRRIFPLLVMVPALWVVAGFAALPAPAASADTAEPDLLSRVSRQDMERIVELLEDPARRETFVQDLKTLLELEAERKKGVSPKGRAPESEGEEELAILDRAAARFESISTHIIRAAEAAWGLIVRTPEALHETLALVRHSENRKGLAVLGGHLLAAILLALLVRWALNGVLARTNERMIRNPGHLHLALARVFVSGLPCVMLLLGLFLLFRWMPSLPRAQLFILFFFTVLIGYRWTVELLRVLLGPDPDLPRILRISDEDANYAWLWGMRLVRYAFFYIVLSQFLRLLRIPADAYAFIRGALLLGFPVMLSAFILQAAAEIQTRLGKRTADTAEPEPVLHRGLRLATRYGRLLLIGYVWAFFLFLILHLDGAFAYLLAATLKTGVVGVCLWLAFRVLDGFFGVLFHVEEAIKARFPGLEAKANRYIHLFRKGLSGLLVIMALGVAGQVWGVPVRDLVLSDIGSMLIWRGFGMVLTVALALVVLEICLFLRRYLLSEDTQKWFQVTQKTRTLIPMLHAGIKVGVWFVAGVIVLDRVGVSVGPILAGAGILGLAVGFGSQTLVKDLINGLFILFEDSIRVGDWINLGDKGGNVEAVSIRTIRLRDLNGNVHVIPNSSVDVLTNLSKEYSRAVMDVGVAYREDVDEVMEILKEIGAEMCQDPDYAPDILEPLEVFGLDRFEDSAVVIRARFTTRPLKQWSIRREFNRRLKRVFDARGIEIPFPHQTLYMGALKDGEAPPLFLKMKTDGGGDSGAVDGGAGRKEEWTGASMDGSGRTSEGERPTDSAPVENHSVR